MLRFTRSWQEIRDIHRRAVEGDPTVPAVARSTAAEYAQGGWSGATGEEAVEWARDGYELPLLEADMPVAITSDRPRWRYSDDSEGDYSHDAFVNGETEYYLSRTRRKGRPGLVVDVSLSLNCSVPAAQVAAFGAWCGSAVAALQAQGYDLQITVTYEADELYGSRQGALAVEVSKFGETVLPRDWSALFSPAGMRHYLFIGVLAVGTEEKARPSSYIGYPLANHRPWAVRFNADTRTLRIETGRGKKFPAEDMTRQLAEVQSNL